jgi:anaerobic ribonucleoside-triphosphate reductase activating protein
LDKPNLHIAGVNYDSLVDGEGVRAAIYLSGCRYHCSGCHNRDAQDPNYGQGLHNILLEDIGYEIMKRPYLSGITLTGGDPLYDPEQTLWMLEDLLAQVGKTTNVWMYTGALWEEVKDLPVVQLVDILVDGPFIQE